MRAGPKAIIGLGAPAALRALTPSKGGGVSLYAFTYNGIAFTFGEVAFTYGAPA